MEKGGITTFLHKAGHDRKSVMIWTVSFVLVMALIAGLGVLVANGGEGKVQAQTSSSAPKGQAGKVAKPGGPMAMLAGKEALDAAASALEMKVTDLQKQLASGKTILQIAKSKGISEDKLKSELEKKLNEAIDKAAKKAKSNLDDFVSNFVKNGPPAKQGGPGGILGVKVPETVASVLGISTADLLKELQAGKTITQVAQEKNVAIENVTAALKQKLTDSIDAAVKAGKLDASRAADMKTKLDTMVQNIIQRQPGKGPGGPPPNGQAPGGAPVDQQAGGSMPLPQDQPAI
jgi:predicted  nucleic acid-binding Zn-ribbon protein